MPQVLFISKDKLNIDKVSNDNTTRSKNQISEPWKISGIWKLEEFPINRSARLNQLQSEIWAGGHPKFFSRFLKLFTFGDLELEKQHREMKQD